MLSCWRRKNSGTWSYSERRRCKLETCSYLCGTNRERRMGIWPCHQRRIKSWNQRIAAGKDWVAAGTTWPLIKFFSCRVRSKQAWNTLIKTNDNVMITCNLPEAVYSNTPFSSRKWLILSLFKCARQCNRNDTTRAGQHCRECRCFHLLELCTVRYSINWQPVAQCFYLLLTISCDMFRPQLLAIFSEIEMLLTCTAYVSTFWQSLCVGHHLYCRGLSLFSSVSSGKYCGSTWNWRPCCQWKHVYCFALNHTVRCCSGCISSWQRHWTIKLTYL